MTETIEKARQRCLDGIKIAYHNYDVLEAKQKEDRKAERAKISAAHLQAQTEADIPIVEQAEILGKKRQSLYLLIKEAEGVRHPNMIRNRKKD